jgi:DNA recombination protein RmuC
MTTFLLAIILFASSAAFVTSLILLFKSSNASRGLPTELRAEMRAGRDESRAAGRELREEVAGSIRPMDEALRRTLGDSVAQQQNHFEGMARQLKQISDASGTTAEAMRTTLDSRVKALQEGNEAKLDAIRKEVAEGLKTTLDAVNTTLDRMTSVQQAGLTELTKQVRELAESNQTTLDRIRLTLDSRIKDLQDGNDRKLDELRKDVSASLQASSETQAAGLQDAAQRQTLQLEGMTAQLKEMAEGTRAASNAIRESLDTRVKELQQSNEQKLDEMRRTVDEKLHDTLEKRLGESFKLVSDRLESVHKGLGEMQSLASGVGDLKRVLTNVKVRGTWAEVQLGAILEQMLTADQWSKNVCVKEGSSERVEFAIRLPGSKKDPERCMWLPIDSKFPKEDYDRLQAAAEAGDSAAVQAASDALLRALRASARSIFEKYVSPPLTTDFAIMFLATEGLYAEALRLPAFAEDLQDKYRVLIAGPSTLAALLSSLRMGFQTLVVEQRAAEVWRVLGAIKTEFGKFGGVLDKVQRHLSSASRTIDETGVRTRAMERHLRAVERLTPSESATILALPTAISVAGAEVASEAGVGSDIGAASAANDSTESA